MQWKALLPAVLVALAAPRAHALLRFACSQLVTERLDPLVTPGQVSPHLHQIIGGNAFNVTMDPANDLAKLSTCTSCQFKENKSNYWTAVLFFKHANGSFIRVPQMPNFGTGSPNGGMTVYYVQNANKVRAFPKGFRMITGNPMLRSKDTKGPPKVTSFRCFGKNFQDSNSNQPPGGGTDSVELPNKPCEGGIRSNTNFPQCWDGVNLDSPDHASHIVHPVGSPDPQSGLNFYTGTCPSTHPIRMPMLIFETIWDTRQFNSMWPTDGSQPFVYSMGDPTGYGHHGDYVFGWEGDALQRAMDTCTAFDGVPSHCSALTVQSDADINKCVLKSSIQEQTEGYLNALPGCNPVQNGPGPATMVKCNGEPTSTAAPIPAPTTVGPSPAPTSPGTGLVAKFGQCGGAGYTGATVCVEGSTCQMLNEWYSQCI